MITLTKMCQLTGVTRRMLQDYAAIGLLQPCERTPGGYWLYHEEDVSRVCMLQLMRRGGFTRSELLALFGGCAQPLEQMLTTAREALTARRRELEELLEDVDRLRLQTAAIHNCHALLLSPASGEGDHSAM
jgi:DNA-binding transcriptional MerR regulator